MTDVALRSGNPYISCTAGGWFRRLLEEPVAPGMARSWIEGEDAYATGV